MNVLMCKREVETHYLENQSFLRFQQCFMNKFGICFLKIEQFFMEQPKTNYLMSLFILKNPTIRDFIE